MKKYVCYLPHVVIAIFVLMSAFGKVSGAPMSVELFNSLNMFGEPDLSRMVLGIAQIILVVLLFNKKTEKAAALLIAINMIGAFVLVAVHFQAVIVLICTLLILLRKGACECKDGVCHHKEDSSNDMESLEKNED